MIYRDVYILFLCVSHLTKSVPGNNIYFCQSNLWKTAYCTFNHEFIKTSHQYRKSHCGYKTAVISSGLHNEISYARHMESLWWNAPWCRVPNIARELGQYHPNKYVGWKGHCIPHITMTSHERHLVSNHRPFDCLFNNLCGRTSKKHQSLHDCPFVRRIHRWRWKIFHVMTS